MSSRAAPSPRQRGLAVVTYVAMLSGLVIGFGDIAAVPPLFVFVAAAAFTISIVAFGSLTYLDSRSSGSGIGAALGRSVRTAGKAVLLLMP